MAASDRPDHAARDCADAPTPDRRDNRAPRPDAPAPRADAAARSEAPVPGDPEFAAEVEAMFALVRRRYGARLTAEELEGVRKAVQGLVEGARALRAVRLGNADEPFQPFAPFRADA